MRHDLAYNSWPESPRPCYRMIPPYQVELMCPAVCLTTIHPLCPSSQLTTSHKTSPSCPYITLLNAVCSRIGPWWRAMARSRARSASKDNFELLMTVFCRSFYLYIRIFTRSLYIIVCAFYSTMLCRFIVCFSLYRTVKLHALVCMLILWFAFVKLN